MLIRLVGLSDMPGVDRSLFLKSLYTKLLTLRVGKARPAWTDYASNKMKYGHFMSAIGGIGSILKGVANFDFGKIGEGAGKLGSVI